jgi:hypothetical protein
MFYTVAVILIAVVLLWVVIDRARLARRPEGVQDMPAPPRLRVIELGLYALLMLGLVILAVTGLAGYAAEGHVVGYWLIGHMVGGGLFATVLPLFMLALAASARLDRQSEREPLLRGEKVLFWLGSVAGWLSLATIVATMLPLFDTAQMTLLLTIHRYSGLALVVLLIPHGYIMLEWRAAGAAPPVASAAARAQG